MKELYYSKEFKKHYNLRIKGNNNLEERFIERLRIFIQDKNNPILKNHTLTGKHRGKRAFSIAGDLRVVYEETNIYYKFLDIGSHNQVY
jgi:addiction module RelE/StbE family toxin